MAQIRFTPNMQKHIDCPDVNVPGKTVAEVFKAAFKGNPKTRSYFLDKNGGLRVHIAVIVDGIPVKDRRKLTDPVGKDGEVYVMQGVPDA
ncbi:MAG: hypothetical protein WD768_02140 [Phycisphaeraceae bacterium]